MRSRACWKNKGVILILSVVLSTCFQSAFADSIAEFVDSLKRGHVDLDTLVALQTLEKTSGAIGYGICMASERQECATQGSLGYGLCMAAGRSGCKEEGSLGYGLCMAGGRSSCNVRAKIGYGLCMAANRSGCQEDL